MFLVAGIDQNWVTLIALRLLYQSVIKCCDTRFGISNIDRTQEMNRDFGQLLVSLELGLSVNSLKAKNLAIFVLI